MSAEALRAFTVEAVKKRIDQYATELVERREDTLDQLRWRQGVIHGLREALELQQDAYKGSE